MIQANGYIEIDVVTIAADFTFLHPMKEGSNNVRCLEEKGKFNRLPGVCAAKNKRKCALVYDRMRLLYGDAFDFAP